MDTQKNPVQWTRVKVFHHAASGLAVAISRLAIRGSHQYSFQVGRLLEEGPVDANGMLTGRVSPHFRVMRDRGSLAAVRFDLDYETIIGALMFEALNWVKDAMHTDLDAELDKRRVKEERDANWGKPKTRHTGKTAKAKGLTDA